MISGDFCWTGEIPDEDESKPSSNAAFDIDFGASWQHLATRPLMLAVCDALGRDNRVTGLEPTQSCNYGWNADFQIASWQCYLWVHWVGDDEDDENIFEFDVCFRHNLVHRVVHRSRYRANLLSLGDVIGNAFGSCAYIEHVVIVGIGPLECG